MCRRRTATMAHATPLPTELSAFRAVQRKPCGECDRLDLYNLYDPVSPRFRGASGTVVNASALYFVPLFSVARYGAGATGLEAAVAFAGTPSPCTYKGPNTCTSAHAVVRAKESHARSGPLTLTGRPSHDDPRILALQKQRHRRKWCPATDMGSPAAAAAMAAKRLGLLEFRCRCAIGWAAEHQPPARATPKWDVGIRHGTASARFVRKKAKSSRTWAEIRRLRMDRRCTLANNG